jgi:septum formation protein
MLFEQKIILGSKSPRRQELLKHICKNVSIRIQDVDEIYDDSIPKQKVPEYLSKLKANALKNSLHEDEILITSDTVVVLENEILGKPTNKIEAKEMLQKISSKKQEVITGCTILNWQKSIQFSETTEVYFHTLSSSEIDYYVENFKPFDKAGSYGIQEWIGMIGIKKINGCYYNVMGLPIAKLYHELTKFTLK